MHALRTFGYFGYVMKRGPIWMIAFLNCTHFDRLICMLSASITQKESQLRIFFLLKWYLWNFLCGCNYKGISRNGLFSHSRNYYCGMSKSYLIETNFAIKIHFDVGRVQLLQFKQRLMRGKQFHWNLHIFLWRNPRKRQEMVHWICNFFLGSVLRHFQTL